MKAGIYHLTLTAAGQMCGEGLAVLRNGSLNGGDRGYLYLGTLIRSDGMRLTGRLKFKKWNHGGRFISGNLDEYDLLLEGSKGVHEETFAISGEARQVPGVRVTITGRKIADAADAGADQPTASPPPAG